MGKDPAFLFYPNDYIGGTMGMTFEEKGAYMDLLMMQFNQGHMREPVVKQLVGVLWDNIKHKFTTDKDGLFFNERLEEEQNKRKAYSNSRRNNIKGTNQHTKKRSYDQHTGGRMEDENEDVNKDLIKNVIKDLNNKTKSNYKYSSEATRRLILARIKEGYKLSDFQVVHSKKAQEWLNTDMSKYLRPQTLYSTKFEGYLNQKESNNGKRFEGQRDASRYDSIETIQA